MKTLSLLFISFLVIGCQTAPKISSDQRRAMQKRTFEADYKVVFNSVRSILQDEGFIIKSQDFNGGMILASKARTNQVSSGEVALVVGLALLGGGVSSYRRKELDNFLISVSFDKVSSGVVDTRLTLQHGTKDNYGSEGAREILDPNMYNAFYSKISQEISRRDMRKQIAEDDSISLNETKVKIVKVKGKRAIIQTENPIQDKEIYLDGKLAKVVKTKKNKALIQFKESVYFEKGQDILLRKPANEAH